MNFNGYSDNISNQLASRLLNLIGTRLAIPVSPDPAEALADIIFRAAVANGYTNIGSAFFRRYTAPLSHRGLLARPLDLKQLADLLGTPNGHIDLLPIQYLRDTSCGGGKSQFSFFGSLLPTKQLAQQRRVAPRSLQKKLVSKAIWHINALVFASDSHELLLERCPQCQALLDFKSRKMYNCSSCGPKIDFRDFPQPVIEFEDEEAIRFVTDLIDPENTTRRQSVSALHPDLSSRNPGHLFSLCVLAARTFDGPRLPISGRRFSTIGSAVRPEYLAAAGRALLQWPKGFAELCQKNVPLDYTRNGSLSHPVAEAIISANSFNKDFCRVVTRAITSTTLDVPLAFPRPERPFQETPYATISRLDGRRWRMANKMGSKSFDSIRNFSCESGIPRGVIRDTLLAKGLRIEEPVEDDTVAALDRIRSGILRIGPPSRKSIPLAAIVNALCIEPGTAWPAILGAVVSGQMPIARTEKPSKSTQASWIGDLHVEDFQTWAEYCKSLRPYTETLDFPIGWADFALHLNITLNAARARFSCFMTKSSTTLREVCRLRTDYISTSEITTLSLLVGRKQGPIRVARYLDERLVMRHPDIENGYYCRVAAGEAYKNMWNYYDGAELREFAMTPH